MYKVNNSIGYVFANCRYSSILTIISYFEKEILPVLVNPVFVYALKKEINDFETSVAEIKDMDMVLHDMDIVINKKKSDGRCFEG